VKRTRLRQPSVEDFTTASVAAESVGAEESVEDYTTNEARTRLFQQSPKGCPKTPFRADGWMPAFAGMPRNKAQHWGHARAGEHPVIGFSHTARQVRANTLQPCPFGEHGFVSSAVGSLPAERGMTVAALSVRCVSTVISSCSQIPLLLVRREHHAVTPVDGS